MGSRSWQASLAKERRSIQTVAKWLEETLSIEGLAETDITLQKRGDLYGTYQGRLSFFEVKIRYKEYGDLLIEEESCEERHSLGWIWATGANYLVYCVLRRGLAKYWILDMLALRNWWQEYGRLANYPVQRSQTDNLYHTKNRAVPLNDIPLEVFIYTPKHGVLK